MVRVYPTACAISNHTPVLKVHSKSAMCSKSSRSFRDDGANRTTATVGKRRTEFLHYLGVLFMSEGRMDQEINMQIGAAAQVKQALHRTILWKRELSRQAKLSIYRPVYVSTLTHGHELWVVAERKSLQIQAA